MQRTSIFASSHLLPSVPSEHNLNCPNCSGYLTELKKVKNQAILKAKQIDEMKPVILEMLESGTDVNKIQQELVELKIKYESLRKRVIGLEQENQELEREGEGDRRQNIKLKKEVEKLRAKIQEKEQKEQEELFQRQKGKDEKKETLMEIDNRSLLSRTTATNIDRSFVEDKQNENSNNFYKHLIKRQKIQQQRHSIITKMSQLLSEF